jgi:hypothetical protein
MPDRGLTEQFDALYDKYVKPIEAEHSGEYVAVAPDGRMLFGKTLNEVVFSAREVLGPGNYTYKVGDRVVGKWR